MDSRNIDKDELMGSRTGANMSPNGPNGICVDLTASKKEDLK